MDASKVVVAVAGGAVVHPTNLGGLLSDWVMIDTPDERDFLFILPADGGLTTQVVSDTADWLADIDAGYTAVAGNVARPRRGRAGPAELIEQDAQDVINVGERESVIGRLIESVCEASVENEGYEPYLLLAWGDDENGPDDETREILSQALEAGVKVLDLTAGLDDLVWVEEPEDAAQAVPMVPAIEEPATEPVQLELPELEPAPEPMLRDEAQATVYMELRDAQRQVADLPTTLAFVYQLLEFLDRAEAAKFMMEYVPGALTLAVKKHLADAVAVELADASKQAESDAVSHAEPTPEPVEESAPKQRGKPRDISSDMLTVFHDETKKTIRLPVGRGRKKQGEERFEMLRSEYEAIKAKYELN